MPSHKHPSHQSADNGPRHTERIGEKDRSARAEEAAEVGLEEEQRSSNGKQVGPNDLEFQARCRKNACELNQCG